MYPFPHMYSFGCFFFFKISLNSMKILFLLVRDICVHVCQLIQAAPVIFHPRDWCSSICLFLFFPWPFEQKKRLFSERQKVSGGTQTKRTHRNHLSTGLSLCRKYKRRANLLSMYSFIWLAPIVLTLLFQLLQRVHQLLFGLLREC